MPRPASKLDLLAAIEKERGALEMLLETLTPEQMTEPGIVGEWSVKDVLAHLIEWEQMCLGWHAAGLRGETPELPAPGFKWNQTPQLNQHIYEKHRERPLDEVLEQFQASHREILEVIQGLSNEKLFTTGHFAWTKKNTLGTYMVSATSSHYLWARKEIRKGFRAKEA
ncbi:MAG: ClbS/DfsB family four-helix bundle protein [Chloroflexota bacterium]|nr:ClbS/DfsB family four-helix bundle protein [Chloroflexota bacterium]